MRRHTGYLLLVAVVVVLLAPAASPIQLSHVTSDSMEPTIETGDGYILVPAGQVIPGEIVTFYAAERAEYVTHRVVGTTTGGFITKGDANPSTDQATGSPPVPRAAITGQVVTAFGQPVVIPQLGTVINLVRTHWKVLAGLLLVSLLVPALRGGTPISSRTTGRSVRRSREVITGVLVIGLLASTLLVSSGVVHSEFTYSVAEAGEKTDGELAVGESTTVAMQANIATTPVTRIIVETAGMRLHNTTAGAATPAVNATAADQEPPAGLGDRIREQLITASWMTINAEIPGQAEPGAHTVGVSVYPYPATLPRGVLTWLHGIHPTLAAVGSAVVPFSLVTAGYWLLLDPATPLRGSRRRWLHRIGDR